MSEEEQHTQSEVTPKVEDGNAPINVKVRILCSGYHGGRCGADCAKMLGYRPAATLIVRCAIVALACGSDGGFFWVALFV